MRGGLMERDRIIASAVANFRDCGIYALSVWSAPEMTAEEIVRSVRSRNPRDLKHGQMRTTTAGRLRTCGFELVEDGPEMHYSLTLPSPPADTDWDVLEQTFDDPEPTPPREET